MSIRRIPSFLFASALSSVLLAQTPVKVEYFLDNDPGYGMAAVIKNLHVGGNAVTFDLSSASEGAHVLYVRAQDDEGHWSSTIARPLFIDRLQDIVYVEYFFDSDPGVGKATSVTLADQDHKAHLELDLKLDISDLELGRHILYVRACDRFDQWTDLLSRSFTIVEGTEPVEPDPQVETDLARIEYFFDTDPGYGKGLPLETPQTGKNTYLMDFSTVSDGAHLLFLRAQDKEGHWSPTISRPLYVMKPAEGEITALEYYFDDDDPGTGKAFAMSLSQIIGGIVAIDINIDELTYGDHQLNVRACDVYGRWSLASSQTFYIEGDTGFNDPKTLRKDDVIYNIRGQKVDGVAQRGIYILNGKKIIFSK